MADRGVAWVVTDGALHLLLKESYDPVYGAHPLVGAEGGHSALPCAHTSAMPSTKTLQCSTRDRNNFRLVLPC